MNIYQRIVEANNGNDDGIAICDRGRRFTYSELFRNVDFIVDRLKKNGLDAGARVAVLAGDSMEYLAVTLGVLASGCVVVPVSTCVPEHELRIMLSEMNINALICSETYHREEDSTLTVPDAFRERYYIRFFSCSTHPIILPEEKHAAYIRYSSGTTGSRKGVVLSHESIWERLNVCQDLNIGRGEQVLRILDVTFHFIVPDLLFLLRGACIVICPSPAESHLEDLLKEYEIEFLYAVPYYYHWLITSDLILPELLQKVKYAFSVSMNLDSADAIAFREKFNIPLMQTYGSIETGLVCVNTSDRLDKVNSVGCLQAAYHLRLADADDSGTGKILLNGPGFFDAYLTPFQLRTDVCGEDVYFNTGDIGRMDEDGYLYLTSRTKNVINYCGIKVFASEIEAVLREHPWVGGCRVYGQNAGSFGEVPVAEIAVAAGIVLMENWEEALREYCSRHLALYKVPKLFRQVEMLPRSSGAKLLRRP